MAKNLYDVLGVAPSAATQDIVKAYRRKAQKMHPDKDTGDEDAFKEVSKAYEVLVDTLRRERYDASGETADTGADTTQYLRELVAVLFSLIDKVPDVRYVNLIEESHKVVCRGMNKAREAIEGLQESIDVRREVLGRIACKDGPNLLAQAIEADIAKRMSGIANMESNLGIGHAVLALLAEYSYTTDTRPVETHGGFTFRSPSMTGDGRIWRTTNVNE